MNLDQRPAELLTRIGNVLIPSPGWPDYVMDLVAQCVNVEGTVDEAWHWAELEEAMAIESEFRAVPLPC